jgi:transposase
VKHFVRKGKVVSDETLRVTLKRLGARYVKAVIAYPEASESERLAFAKRFVKELRSLENSVLVFFEDEMSAELSARKGYGWTFNERLVIEAPQANRERLNLFGAVSPFSGEVIQMTSKESKAGAFARFLDKITLAHPRKRVHVYLDNLPVHYSRKVKRFLAKHPNLQLKPLPPYSPELNPREYWHSYLRKKLLNNQSFNPEFGNSVPVIFYHNMPF